MCSSTFGRFDRHHRMDDGVVEQVDEVERLGAVLRARAAGGHGEVLGVAGGGRHRDGDARERGERRVVQVPRDDRAHVAAAQDRGQTRLVAQLDAGGQWQHARHRWVVQGEDRAQRRGRRQDAGQPRELLVRELAVMPAGHGGIQCDQSQAVEFEDRVDRRGVAQLSQEGLAERRPVVMVAHHPDDPGAQTGGERVDQSAQPRVGIPLAEIGQVAGEHHGVGLDAAGLDHGERSLEVRGRVDQIEQPRAACAQVGVAEVQQDPLGLRVLGGAHGLVSPAPGGRSGLPKCYRHVSADPGRLGEP